MNPLSEPAPTTGSSRWRKRLWTLAFIVGMSGFLWSQLPHGGYPTDLSLIGKGRPALVLAHDSNYAGGMAVMYLMNEIRDEYADRVDFLVAHLGMDDGQAFARSHGARDGVVLLFGRDGANIGRIDQPQTVGELRTALDRALGY